MVKLFVMDVDGTLTDGKINMSADGELYKAFNIKDGYGINEILPKNGIVPAIITGRKSKIVENRANELHIKELYQGKHDKYNALMELMTKYGCEKDDVAYIGDDVLDIVCMKECGVVGCPNDAVGEVKEISHYVAPHNGGDGAVRDFIEWIIQKR